MKTITKEKVRRSLEHLVVGVVVLLSTTWAPSCVASSWVVERGVTSTLSWAEPRYEEDVAEDPPAAVLERLRGLTQRGVQTIHELGYTATRVSVGALAHVIVWAFTFLGLLAWGVIELRWAITTGLGALIALTGDFFTRLRRAWRG